MQNAEVQRENVHLHFGIRRSLFCGSAVCLDIITTAVILSSSGFYPFLHCPVVGY